MNALVTHVWPSSEVGAVGFAFVPQLLGSNRADKRMKGVAGRH